MICIVDDSNKIINIISNETPILPNERITYPWNKLWEQYTNVPPLEYLKQQKHIEMSDSCANAITGGFVSSCSGQAVKYDSDKDTQLTMQGIALNVNSPIFASKYPNGCLVRGYVGDSTTKTVQWLNAEQVLALLADLSNHIGQCKQKGWGIQASIEACLTVAEVEAIEWI